MSKMQNQNRLLQVAVDMGGIPNGIVVVSGAYYVSQRESIFSPPITVHDVVCKVCGHEEQTSDDFCSQCWGEVAKKEKPHEAEKRRQGKVGELKNYGVIIATK